MVNKVLLVGRIGTEPVIRTTKTGLTVASVSFVTSESRLVDNKWEEYVEWHNLVAFGKLGDRLGKVIKGDVLYVDGKIHYDSYEKDGARVYRTNINIDNMRILVTKTRQAAAYSEETQEDDPWGQQA